MVSGFVSFCRFCLHLTKGFFLSWCLISRFYTLLVISTALFDKPPFKNLIVNGLVLAAWVYLLFSYRARFFSLVSKLVAFLFTWSKCFTFIGLGNVRLLHVCLFVCAWFKGMEQRWVRERRTIPIQWRFLTSMELMPWGEYDSNNNNSRTCATIAIKSLIY